MTNAKGNEYPEERAEVLYGYVDKDETGRFQEGDVVITSPIQYTTHGYKHFHTKQGSCYVINKLVNETTLSFNEWRVMRRYLLEPVKIVNMRKQTYL
jgi:hypothetical protein